jgi:hypothetical protein
MITNPSVWRAPAGAPAQGTSGARAAPFVPVPPPRASSRRRYGLAFGKSWGNHLIT